MQTLIESSRLTIAQYEKNLALEHAGLYDEMTNVNYQYVEDYQNVEDVQKEALEASYETEKRHYDELRALKKKYGDDTVDQQLLESEALLNAYEKQMKQYEKTTTDSLDTVEVEWSDSLDDQLSAITGHDVDFKDAGGGLVDVYIDGVKSGEQLSKNEVKKLATDAINEITKQEGKAKSAGENLIKGINNGIGKFLTPKFHENVFRLSRFNTAVVFPLKVTGNLNQVVILRQEVILNFPAIPAYKVRVRPLRYRIHIGAEKISVIIVFVRASVGGSSFTGQDGLEKPQGETAPIKIFSFHR
jgi:hypothetical protein